MFTKILSYTGEYRKKTYLSIFCMILGVIANTLPYLFIYQLIAPLLSHGKLTVIDIVWRVAAIAVCAVLYAVLYIKGLALSHDSAYHTLENIRVSLQKKLESQPLGAIQERGTGVLKKMFIDDIESMELLLAHAIPEGIANLSVPVFLLVAMFIVDWRLALLSLCSTPLGLIASALTYKIGTSRMGDYYNSARKMNNTIVEYVNGMEVVKVFNRDGESYRRFENDIRSYRDFTLAWYKACWPWMAIYTSILPCIALFTLPVGAYLVFQGICTLPNFLLVLCLGFAAGTPLAKAINFISLFPQLNFKLDSLEKMMDTSPLQQTKSAFSGRDHNISFDNVHFSYKEDEVLHGVTFSIPEGSMTALVGESGGGKSTIAKLLVHFYDVSDGSVKLGGQDLRDMSIEALNNEISYVAQEQFLFNMSLMDNIRLGKLDATDDEVIAAAEKAQCGEFLKRLPQGIKTMAADGGKMLSGGERQRISLARAILKNAPVVVLDEATAFMDPENEEKMNEAIAEVINGKTVIVIAHRLHSIVNADQICLMANGDLIAEGTHEELLENCPEYQKLWSAAEGTQNWSVKNGEEVLA